MTIVSKLEAPHVDPIAAHVHAAPVVHEIPANASQGLLG